MKYLSQLLFLIIVTISFGLSSCKKGVLAAAPSTSLNGENVYINDASTAAVLTGIYDIIMQNNNLENSPLLDMSLFPSLSADELTLWGGANAPVLTGFYTNTITNITIFNTFWENIYPIIYTTNDAIDGISNSTSLTPSVRQQALGEAYFIRAFCYFYLVNLYGNIPLVTTTNYKINESIARSPSSSVWQQIISDLKIASALLSTSYLDATLQNPISQRLRPTKWAACALLARVYLYQEQWQNAINEADTVIQNSALFQLDSLNSVFLISSTEAIWQLQPVSYGWNTPDAQIFIIPSSGLTSSNPVYLSPNLLTSFEANDSRKLYWTDTVSVNNQTYYYPYKYKNNNYNSNVTEYEMVIRLGELFLIRAESEAQIGNFINANSDLNTIRNRAGLSGLNITNLPQFMTAILHERQVELFTEWGNRWLDLKRTNTLNSTMGVPGNEYQIKMQGGMWNSDWSLYPISQSELSTNTNLVQNPGY
jgi:hypothetical protein